MTRDGKTNRAHAYASPRGDAKEAVLRYRLLGGSKNYRLLEVELITGRHHQIRCQLAKAGCPIKGDLKYGAPRSNPGGGISLHSRSLSFVHPVRREPLTITAPVPKEDSLWSFFENRHPAAESGKFPGRRCYIFPAGTSLYEKGVGRYFFPAGAP